MSKTPETQALVYQTDDGITRVEVRMTGETVWLNQNQMASLFQSTKQNVGQHIHKVQHHREAGINPESARKTP